MTKASPRIGECYMLVQTAMFEEIETGKKCSVHECSDAVQGAWPDGEKHPYEDDPFYVIAEAFILTTPLEPMTFKDTNQEIAQVAWQSPMGFWYKTDISNLKTI